MGSDREGVMYPRSYPQTYASQTERRITKVIESLLSCEVSTLLFAKVFYDNITRISESIGGRSIDKQTIAFTECVVVRSSMVIREVFATINSIPTRTSKIARRVSASCNILSEFVGVRAYSKFISATHSVIGAVDQYIITKMKFIEGSVSSTLLVSRGASKRLVAISDAFAPIQRSVSKTCVGTIINLGFVWKRSFRVVRSIADIIATESRTVIKTTITKSVVGCVGGSGTISKTTVMGFVKKMFTYPADPEFKVEEDE